jgi:chemotaxis protein MotB
MPPPAKPIRPIIVIKKKVSHGAHHGGAWKVAYADFVTAMMSLFIVLWLLNTSPQIKKSVAGYFNDPSSSGRETGTKTVGSDESIAIDQKNVEKLKEEIEKAILKQTDLTKLSKQIDITVTGEGLKIELIEDKGGTFFQSGSPKLSDNGVELLNLLSAKLKTLPNRLLIEGHTDSQPFSNDSAYTNWELSSDRANSARRLLQQDGLGPNRISQVRGYADQALRVPSNPLDPTNRRISLIVQWLDAAPALPGANLPIPAGALPTTAHTSRTSSMAAPPASPAPGAESHGVAQESSPAVSRKQTAPVTASAHQPAWMVNIKGLVSAKK